MRKVKKTSKEIQIKDSWNPSTEFSNYILARIYSSVPDYIRVIFGYDFESPENEEKYIYLSPKGSAEIAYLPLKNFMDARYIMNLASNELFDPKEEGYICVWQDTHEELVLSIERIQEALEDWDSEKLV